MLYIIYSLPLAITSCVVVLKSKYFFKRYFFIFFTVISDIVSKYIISDNFISIFTTFNEEYYQQNIYLIPLSFATIQLSIEAYYFYKKEKPKWIRYERMKGYKETFRSNKPISNISNHRK